MSGEWPNPTEWIRHLASELQGLDEWFLVYEGIRTGRLTLTEEDRERRGIIEPVEPEIVHQYARVVSRVVEALERLPPFERGEGLAALRALRFDLVALDGGNKPIRLQHRPNAAVGDNRGRRVAKAHLVAYVRLLEELNVENETAREIVAKAFKAAGYRRISASSLYRWTTEICGASENDPDRPGRQFVERELATWKAQHDWPFTQGVAEQLIKQAAAGVTISLAHST